MSIDPSRMRSKPTPKARRERRPARPRRPLALEWLEDRTLPATFLVTITDDAGAGTLRQAITDSNANPGSNVIDFNIGTGVQTISLQSALPAVTVPALIDGTSEPDFAGTPEIVLDGTNAGAGVNGLTITAGNSTVKGLVIDHFTGSGIALQGSGGNVIAGNFVGVDSTGATAAANGGDGVSISGGSSTNTVGGTTAAALNVLSANAGSGVEVSGSGANGNVVEGDYIGTDVSGTLKTDGNGNPLGNGNDGVAIHDGAANNTVGGTVSGALNVISANTANGVEVFGGGATNNAVQGNFIGTDVTGAVALGNGNDGVAIHDGAGNNIVGGRTGTTTASNVISGNTADGVEVFGGGANSNAVQGNFIGTDVTGGVALANGNDGVAIHDGAGSNTVGGPVIVAGTLRNVISGNTANGVNIFTTSSNLVQGNLIGTAVNGTAALGNGGNGVLLTNAFNNAIGTASPLVGNVIAFNGADGVKVDTGTGNAVRANSIHDSTNLGIELVNGGNGNQAAPALTSAVTTGSSITIHGTLTAAANTSYALDFFASPTANASGFGEGQQLLGSATETTNGSGTVNFTLTFAASVPAGQAISATATSPAGNTSAFAQDVTAVTATHLVIVPTFDSSITNDPNAAVIESTINAAIQVYENTYTNPITVQIYFREGGGLGSSITGLYDIGYQSFRSGLAANQALSGQSDQATALAHLPNQANNPVTNNTDLVVSSADGRALGRNTPGFLNSSGGSGGTFDGVITVNTAITFPPQPNNGSNYSLSAVTEHEIDEVLGTPSALPNPFNFGRGPAPLGVDLYRYNGSGARSFTSATTTAFFSIDGTTNLVQYHNTNDGADYGDWQNQAGNPRVQDAFGTPGATPSLGVELTVLDVLGYDRFSPGPSTPNSARGDFATGFAVVVPPSRSARVAVELPRALPGLPPPAGAADGSAAEVRPALPLPVAPLLASAPGAAPPLSLAGPPSAAPTGLAATSAGAGVTGALDRFLATAADDLGAALAGTHAAAADDGPGPLVEALGALQAPPTE
jgi:hypothetical protein